MRGRAAIKAAYTGAGGFSRKKGEADVGKYTLTLKKDSNGRWLIFSDMDNGNKR